jgi:membrane protease YdiL (CAAX protease family)
MFLLNGRKGKTHWLYYLATLILVFGGYFIGQLPLTVIILLKSGNGIPEGNDMQSILKNLDFQLLGIDTNVGLVLLLLSFVGAMLFLYLGVVFVHKRNFNTIITGSASIRWKRILYGLVFWLLLTVVGEIIIFLLNPANYRFDLDYTSWIPLLAICLTLIPIQTTFEELFVRGYLLQGIAGISGNAWIPVLVTSIVFGLLHVSNPEVSNFGFGIMMVYYVSVGLFLAALTVIDDGVELALGIHAATNIYGAGFVTFKGSALQTAAPVYIDQIDARLMLAILVMMILIFLVISARFFDWSDWKRLFRSIYPENDNTESINKPVT